MPEGEPVDFIYWYHQRQEGVNTPLPNSIDISQINNSLSGISDIYSRRRAELHIAVTQARIVRNRVILMPNTLPQIDHLEVVSFGLPIAQNYWESISLHNRHGHLLEDYLQGTMDRAKDEPGYLGSFVFLEGLPFLVLKDPQAQYSEKLGPLRPFRKVIGRLRDFFSGTNISSNPNQILMKAFITDLERLYKEYAPQKGFVAYKREAQTPPSILHRFT